MTSSEHKPYIYSWNGGGKYRLEKLTIAPQLFKLPCKDETLKLEELPAISILTSERLGGIGTFLSWAGKQKNAKEILVENLEGYLEQHTLEQQENESSDKDIIGQDVLIINAKSDPVEPEFRASLAARLERYKGGKIILITRNIQDLDSDPLYSTVLARAHVFRLPRLNDTELESWLTHFIKRHGIENISIEERKTFVKIIKIHLGGQPFLCRLFFSVLEDGYTENEQSLNEDLVKKSCQYIIQTRPSIIKKWWRDLEPLLKDVGTRKLFKSYTYGDTVSLENPSYFFGQPDRMLYLSGWVGKTWGDKEGQENPQWGISSLAHKTWGRLFLSGALR